MNSMQGMEFMNIKIMKLEGCLWIYKLEEKDYIGVHLPILRGKSIPFICLEDLLFSHWVMSISLWPHGRQHSRLPCPSPSLRACSNSCPLSRWCIPTSSSSVIPFSFCLQSFPASVYFPMSQLFVSGGQSIRASASVLPVNIQDWFSWGLTGLISLQSKGLSRVFSNTSLKASILQRSAFLTVQLPHPYMTTGRTISLTRRTYFGKVMSLLFNMPSRFVIAFLPKSIFSFNCCSDHLQWFWSSRK